MVVMAVSNRTSAVLTPRILKAKRTSTQADRFGKGSRRSLRRTRAPTTSTKVHVLGRANQPNQANPILRVLTSNHFGAHSGWVG